MKRIPKLAVLAAAPLLTAALWMDVQPSYKPYKAPLLAPPAGAVPFDGREVPGQRPGSAHPASPTPASLVEGKRLFDINCAFCHGQTSAEPGPVGKKLNPPPPALGQDLLRELTDAVIYKAITAGFGRMPAFRNKLTPRERWYLVNYLRTRK